MNVCFILVLSVVLQYLLSFIVKLLLPQFVGSTAFGYFYTALVSVITVFLPAYLYLKDEKKDYFTDCFSKVKPSVNMLIAAAIGICAQYVGIAVNLPVNILISSLGGDISNNPPVISGVGLLIGGIIVMCVIPAVLEEILFRGIVFNYFRPFGEKSAILISALLFSVMHMDYTNTLGTFLLGIICGILVKHTNRIIYPMITHFAMNLVSVVSTYLANYEIAYNIYNDYFVVLILVAIPLTFYLMGIFKQRAVKLPYSDEDKLGKTTEKIIEINEESSIRIIEHDIRENNLKMAFSKLLKSPYFYILLALYIFIGGTKIWELAKRF